MMIYSAIPAKSFERRLVEKRRYMEKIKKPRMTVLDDIIEFCIPELERMAINDSQDKGRTLSGKRYNGEAMLAVDLYASGWFGYSISPALDWIRVIDPDPEWMLNEEVKLWMDIIENRLYTVFENSNFYETEALKLRYSPCMGFVNSYMEEDLSTGFPIFKVNHPGKVFIMDDMKGRASTTLIIDKIIVGEAIERFGEKNLSRSLVDAARNDEYQEWEFCQLVEPNPEHDDRSIFNTKMPFRSIWWQSNSGDPGNREGIKIVRESGYPFNPHTNWRMRKGTTPYGYGLAEAALVDIFQSNSMTKDLLMASNRMADPSMNIPIEMQGSVDLRPHGTNYYADPNRLIHPTNTGINYNIPDNMQDRINSALNRHFHVDFFTLLANLEGKAKTATEIIELAGEKAAIISMPIMKYNYENLEEEIKNVLIIERNAGRIPPPPAVYGDREPVIDFIGPLSQAQRKLFQGRGITAALEQLGPIWDRFPETVDKIDTDVVEEFIMTTYNFPAKAIRKEDDVLAIRENRRQQQQDQAQQETILNQSAAAEKMAKADKYTGGKITEGMEA